MPTRVAATSNATADPLGGINATTGSDALAEIDDGYVHVILDADVLVDLTWPDIPAGATDLVVTVDAYGWNFDGGSGDIVTWTVYNDASPGYSQGVLSLGPSGPGAVNQRHAFSILPDWTTIPSIGDLSGTTQTMRLVRGSPDDHPQACRFDQILVIATYNLPLEPPLLESEAQASSAVSARVSALPPQPLEMMGTFRLTRVLEDPAPPEPTTTPLTRPRIEEV